MNKTPADSKQVDGTHYKQVDPAQEHWNLVVAYNWDYFTAQAIKYLMRWRLKGGVSDLKKAQHFIEKLIEVEQQRATEPTQGYVNQG